MIGESTLSGCVQTNVITVSEKISLRASLWPRGLDADHVIVKFPVWFWVWTFVACLTLLSLPMLTVCIDAVTAHERQKCREIPKKKLNWGSLVWPECYKAAAVATVNNIWIKSMSEGRRLCIVSTDKEANNLEWVRNGVKAHIRKREDFCLWRPVVPSCPRLSLDS